MSVATRVSKDSERGSDVVSVGLMWFDGQGHKERTDGSVSSLIGIDGLDAGH